MRAKRDTKEEFERSSSGFTSDVTRVPHLHSFHTLRCWLVFCLSLKDGACFLSATTCGFICTTGASTLWGKKHCADQIEDIFVKQTCNQNAVFKTKSEIILTSFSLTSLLWKVLVFFLKFRVRCKIVEAIPPKKDSITCLTNICYLCG